MTSSITNRTACDKHNPHECSQDAEVIEVNITHTPIDNIGDVIYAQVLTARSVRQLHMSVLVPRTDQLKPAIIYFPGGGFTSAEHNKFIVMRMALAEAGFVVAAAEYRTIPDIFPAPLIDARSAVRYIRQHAADYGVDPTRIGVLGDSAGGWLAQMLGTTNGDDTFDKGSNLCQPSDVQAVATLYGISDLRNIGAGFSEAVQHAHHSPAVTEALLVHGVAFNEFAGASITSSPAKALAASPVGHMSADTPPFLIMHGSKDSLVSPEQSATLYQTLKERGNSADYIIIDGAEHGDQHWHQPAVISRVVNWFRKILGSSDRGDQISAKNQDTTF